MHFGFDLENRFRFIDSYFLMLVRVFMFEFGHQFINVIGREVQCCNPIPISLWQFGMVQNE